MYRWNFTCGLPNFGIQYWIMRYHKDLNLLVTVSHISNYRTKYNVFILISLPETQRSRCLHLLTGNGELLHFTVWQIQKCKILYYTKSFATKEMEKKNITAAMLCPSTELATGLGWVGRTRYLGRRKKHGTRSRLGCSDVQENHKCGYSLPPLTFSSTAFFIFRYVIPH